MMAQIQRLGDTIRFGTPPALTAWAAVAGKKESEGPLAQAFDELITDTHAGQKTWEAAESVYQQRALEHLLEKAELPLEAVECVFGGDLENQCTGTSYTMRRLDVPFVGLYGACSTMAESLGVAACFVAGGMLRRAIAMTSSHFCTAERQYRTPLEYGGQRTPTAQWTATCAGACLLECGGDAAAYVHAVTFGRVQDYGVTDINNMGAAMAPAAASTIRRYFLDTGADPDAFDAIYTGDLGLVGSELLLQLLEEQGLRLKNHKDCGLLLFDREKQTVGAGGSGCGCSAGVLCSHILPGMAKKELRRVLLVSTGALMSQIVWQQGESIPGVAHLVELCAQKVPDNRAGTLNYGEIKKNGSGRNGGVV